MLKQKRITANWHVADPKLVELPKKGEKNKITRKNTNSAINIIVLNLRLMAWGKCIYSLHHLELIK